MTKMSLDDFFKLLRKYNVEEIEGVSIEGDIEIEIEGGASAILSILQALAYELGMASYHLARASQILGFPIEQLFGAKPIQPQVVQKVEEEEKKLPVELIKAKFEPVRVQYSGVIQEVTLGATKSEGGTREYTITVGGEKSLPFYLFDAEQPNLPVITIDVFDKPVPFPKAVREHYEDVMEDPAEWARKVVREFGADMVTIHLISTDPLLDDTPISEAVKTVEEVLQAVKCPIVVGGSGNKEKDPPLLEKVAEVAEGERVMLASATLDIDWERIVNAAKKYNHVVLAWTQLDINAQKTLNRYLIRKGGLPQNSLIMDPTTAPLGYGLDYAFSNMERIRLSALKGDKDLAFPISSGTTNAWGAREAWMKESPIAEDTPWGAREFRGPLWEIITGLTLALAGVDIFMMLHPASVAVLKDVIGMLGGKSKESLEKDWLVVS